MTPENTWDFPHPLLAVPMNRVSDLGLAVACQRAGIMPSISAFNYYESGRLNAQAFIDDLRRFAEQTGDNRILMSVSPQDLLVPELVRFAAEGGFRYFEVFKWEIPEERWRQVMALCSALAKRDGAEVFFKVHRHEDAMDPQMRTVVFKGNDGAGRVALDAGTLEENFTRLRERRPGLRLIPSGGIGTAAQVRHYLERGATAVGIGTLFAASEESCVARETKLKMIEADAQKLSHLGKFQHRGLVFSKPEGDDLNNTRALELGIRSPEAGAVFAGKGISHVTRILPVKDIVAALVGGGAP
jgi:hypothetical protein